MADDFTLLYHEILDQVHKAKTKEQKVKLLKKYNTDGLRMVIKASFDPNIHWAVPEGEVPFRVNDAPDGTEHTRLATESKSCGTSLKVQIKISIKTNEKICISKCWKDYLLEKQEY